MKNEYWAWRDNKDGSYHFIYPSKLLVKLCFPDGGARSIREGEGKIVKVKIVEIGKKKV